MPLVCKIFELIEPLELEFIAMKLKDFKQVYTEEVEGREVELGSLIRDLALAEDLLSGVYEESFLVELPYRGEYRKVPVSKETKFFFTRREDKIFLIIGDRKLRANFIANKFSKILFAKRGGVLEATIAPQVLKSLYESRKSSVKVMFFDDVKIPNINKLSLYGDNVVDTNLYAEYLKYGKVWYIVFEYREGLIVGLTRNCVVTAFSKMSEEEFYRLVFEEILPLISLTASEETS
ncbi:MAG: hypothetical protein DRJ52_10460 [Thermoprotei archaeon]|nr:MAG: hypothetical protein DRJ52_10460 [Thermoprotei archaeon]RLE99510.1 MAG: hypothetical protein DRJ63_05195 [Thermoprotei archaeon]